MWLPNVKLSSSHLVSLSFSLSLYPSAGYDRNFCQLVADPADPDCCQIAICDKTKKEVDSNRENSSQLVLDSVEPLNSTTARLRVILPLNGTKATDLELHFAKVDASQAITDANRLKPNWQVIRVTSGHVRPLSAPSNAFEMDVHTLDPSTEYFMKMFTSSRVNGGENITSNTVVVRTFPSGINSTFDGCFHGNRSYEVGQIFYDGCAYKCACHEGGISECEERCPVFIDTVGYENCDWQPAPDDPCCTIPVCDNKASNEGDPGRVHFPPMKPSVDIDMEAEDAFCIVDNQAYSVGQSWGDGNGCLKRTCTCIQLNNGTTSADCKGGCAMIPQTALKPSVECPKPELVTPDDPCLCPYVVCSHKINRKLIAHFVRSVSSRSQ